MKALTNIKTVVDGTKVTITGDIVEREFNHPVQQVTVGFAAEDNPLWIRHGQISQEAVFARRIGTAFAIPLEEFVLNIASIIEPKLSYPPKPRKSSEPLTVEFYSELEPELQWLIADSPNVVAGDWREIPEATGKTLDPKGLPKGKFVCCRASSDAGSAFTPAIKL